MIKPFMCILTGPTAVGKTDIVLKIAERIPSEIINADSGQFYEPLSVGTAKPDWKHEPVPHHLFDIIKTPTHFSVTEFRKRLLEVANDIISRNKLPLVVGGSAFYVKSIFYPPSTHDEDGGAVQTEDATWEELYAIDPQRAEKIHKQDIYRINRAMALWRKTGKLPSTLAPTYQPPMPFHCVVLTRDRQELYHRIDERVVQMIDHGWIDEVERLLGTPWEEFLKTKKIIGYDIIVEYLQSGTVVSHRDEMIARIQQKTRQYAKRQMTFFSMLVRELEEEFLNNTTSHAPAQEGVEVADLTLLNVDLYIKQLLKKLSE